MARHGSGFFFADNSWHCGATLLQLYWYLQSPCLSMNCCHHLYVPYRSYYLPWLLLPKNLAAMSPLAICSDHLLPPCGKLMCWMSWASQPHRLLYALHRLQLIVLPTAQLHLSATEPPSSKVKWQLLCLTLPVHHYTTLKQRRSVQEVQKFVASIRQMSLCGGSAVISNVSDARYRLICVSCVCCWRDKKKMV